MTIGVNKPWFWAPSTCAPVALIRQLTCVELYPIKRRDRPACRARVPSPRCLQIRLDFWRRSRLTRTQRDEGEPVLAVCDGCGPCPGSGTWLCALLASVACRG